MDLEITMISRMTKVAVVAFAGLGLTSTADASVPSFESYELYPIMETVRVVGNETFADFVDDEGNLGTGRINNSTGAYSFSIHGATTSGMTVPQGGTMVTPAATLNLSAGGNLLPVVNPGTSGGHQTSNQTQWVVIIPPVVVVAAICAAAGAHAARTLMSMKQSCAASGGTSIGGSSGVCGGVQAPDCYIANMK